MSADAHSPPDQPLSLETMLDSFIDSDETITYRAVAKKLGLAVSSVTRSASRRVLIDAANQRQKKCGFGPKEPIKPRRKTCLASSQIKISESRI